MRGEPETTVVRLVTALLGARIVMTPAWLLRPGSAECGRQWPLMRSVYGELSGLELPDLMPPRERRKVDAVLEVNGTSRILEVDETQHFNRYRALTLRRYPRDAEVAFPIDHWTKQCDEKTRLEGGGFGRPKPPLFPAENGRHMQRAFRDMLADLLPLEHGFLPTLRIASFEVEPWIYTAEADGRIRALLGGRI